MGVYDYEQDDAQPGWEQDYRLNCVYCESGTRMPGHPICRMCEWRVIPGDAHAGILKFEALLAANAPWSEYQVTHGLI